MQLFALALLAVNAAGVAATRISANHSGSSCAAADLKVRSEIQNKLAGACEDMCKEVGAHPKCNCPDFVAPDSTPGVYTWEELLGHMDTLVEWSQGKIKGWKKMSAQIQRGVHVKKAAFRSVGGDQGCEALDLQHRQQVQNKLAGACEDMCKEVGAHPKCNCPDFVAPDATPGVYTWEELLSHMDNLVAWGQDTLKGWKKTAAQLQIQQHVNASAAGTDKACAAEDLRERAHLQSRLAGACTTMCKEVGSYPKCNCPDFVEPDSTPGVMTWDELTEYMDNLVSWAGDSIKGWKKTASQLQKVARVTRGGSRVAGASSACLQSSAKNRALLQNKLAGACEEMCKEVGSYPKCSCPDFVEPDSTPGEMTWDELNEYMDGLVMWSGDTVKAWKNTASQLQLSAAPRRA